MTPAEITHRLLAIEDSLLEALDPDLRAASAVKYRVEEAHKLLRTLLHDAAAGADKQASDLLAELREPAP